METSTETNSYNGWKNYQTWNVALWIGNDEGLYLSARSYVLHYPNSKAPYTGWLKSEGLIGCTTPDRIRFDGSKLDYKALNVMMKELVS